MTGEEVLGFFDPKFCLFDLVAHTQDEVLEEVLNLVAPEGSSNHQVILDMLRNREALGSTAVGKGFAIPHGRSLAVSQLMAIFARSKKGVQFTSLDGEPTHLFFVLLAPPQDRGNLYLPLLGSIVEIVGDDTVRDRLMQVPSFEELATVIREARVS